MNYFELFKHDYRIIQPSCILDFHEIVQQCHTILKPEWIEEEDMLYYKKNAFSMNIDEIIETMPRLSWSKIAYETLKRKTGSCCHFSAFLSACLCMNNITNSIAIGSCLLNKGKYAGMRGIHYWNLVEIDGSVTNIDLCSTCSDSDRNLVLTKDLFLHHVEKPFG
jgi:hypothetical protein